MAQYLKFRGALYRSGLRPEQRELKKDWLLQQHRGIPTWEEIWTEIKTRESEWDSYIVKEAKRLHPDWELVQVGKIPVGQLRDFTDQEVETQMSEIDPDTWDRLQRRRDTLEYDRLFGTAYASLTDRRDAEVRQLLPLAEQTVQREVYLQYRRLADQIRRADGKPCWRALLVKRDVDPTKIQQVGRYWTTDHEAAQPYWANHSKLNWATHRVVVWRALVDVDQLDWKETVGARFIVGWGDREKEVRFFKHAKLWIESAEIYDRADSWYSARTPDRVVPIQQMRRA